MTSNYQKSESEWRQLLTPLQFEIARRKGTERAFSGEYYNFKGKGIYKCICCGNALFNSTAKYDSGSGWPSFWTAISDDVVKIARDYSLGMVRDEVTCKKCGAHLGHLFEDGPEPTGLRYCINSAALKFVEGKDNPEKALDE